MRLLQFEYRGKLRVGVEASPGGEVISVTDADESGNLVSFLESPQCLQVAKMCIMNNRVTISRNDIRLKAPVTKPEKIICVGLNYKDESKMTAMQKPTEPVIFSKFPSCIIGDTESIVLPTISNAVDWEAELCVVIGKEGKNIKVAQAMDHVIGFTVANDVTARDWYRSRNGGQVLLAKTFDTFCPLGPTLVTKDEISDPHNLRIRCFVNDTMVQDDSTSNMIFKIDECVAWISRFCVLKPGDLILTGTPPGSGASQNPPAYLKKGDVLRTTIEEIGEICNTVTG